jgi:Ca2+-binding EF-hand superfamily protein
MIAELENEGTDIDFDQFLDAITSKLGNRETRDGINKIFELFDDDGSNSINLNNLKRVNTCFYDF